MSRLSTSQKLQVKNALSQLKVAAQELSNVLDETGYELSNAAPNYLTDVDDFAYELTSFFEDEVDELGVLEEIVV